MSTSETLQATTIEQASAGTTDTTQNASGTPERFVVGVDGSAQSIEALRLATRIAAGIGARVDVVAAWKPRVGMAGPMATPVGTFAGPQEDARVLLERARDAAYGSDRPPHMMLREREGDAADILIEESKTAHLLVVGSRGLGQLAGLLLGSVSARCAEKAHCPVLIMHAPDEP